LYANSETTDANGERVIKFTANGKTVAFTAVKRKNQRKKVKVTANGTKTLPSRRIPRPAAECSLEEIVCLVPTVAPGNNQTNIVGRES